MNDMLLVLVLWNVAQGIFLLWQIQKLTNKLMSRDFAEYHRVNLETAKEKKVVQEMYPDEMLSPPPNDLGF